jgi:hypothetical protein
MQARAVDAAVLSPCGVWQSLHVVVACAPMPFAFAWHVTHVGAALAGENE